MTNPKFKVIIAEQMAPDGVHLLHYNPNFDVVVLDKNEKDKLLTELQTAHAVVVRSGVKITPDHLKNAPLLKIVGRAGAGYDNINVDACTKKGIAVMTVPSGNSNAVAELSIGLLIALSRFIPRADHTMKAGLWEKNKLEGVELRGRTIGLVGLGRIGGLVGAACEALGMKVMALVQNKNKKRNLPFHGIFVEKLDELLPNVDYLSLHAPLSDKTRNMIGANELAMMKPGAFLVNTSRGDLVDEKALFEVLKAKKINGAAIDVYSTEPASKEKFPFIELDNVIAIPHLGASTLQAQSNVSKVICENIIEALTSGVYIDAVNLPFNIPSDEADLYRPYIVLAKKLAMFAGQWNQKPIKEIKLTYRFTQQIDIQAIAMTASATLLSYSLPDVSLINISTFMESHGIAVVIKNSEKREWDDSIKLAIKYEDGQEFFVRGVVAAQTVPRIIEIDEKSIDLIPTGHMIVIENRNVPGIVGAVGTLLGAKGINISDMHLSKSESNKTVVGCISVDNDVPDEVLINLKKIENVLDARRINV